MGPPLAMLAAPPGWPVAVPPSVSLLHGDVPAEDVMLGLVSPRDEELCQGRPDYRSLLDV